MSWHINSIKTYDLNGTYTRVLTMLVLVTLIGLTHNVGISYLNWTYTRVLTMLVFITLIGLTLRVLTILVLIYTLRGLTLRS